MRKTYCTICLVLLLELHKFVDHRPLLNGVRSYGPSLRLIDIIEFPIIEYHSGRVDLL